MYEMIFGGRMNLEVGLLALGWGDECWLWVVLCCGWGDALFGGNESWAGCVLALCWLLGGLVLAGSGWL